ncbi:IclR family transcriptional regulator [Lentzea roselyniae]|uniref:IclR family transcriptional regulator n=1 Tax=Lentzea roselyniae TaxID=531940 RepID=A0ABP7C3C5_9PSEU
MTDLLAAERRPEVPLKRVSPDVAESRERKGAATKVLAVLEAFSAQGGSISLAELTDRTGLPKSTAHRMLCFLRDAEFVESINGHYYLSNKVSMLSAGQPTALSPGVRARLMPYLAELYELTHEVVQLIVRAGSSVHVIERIHGYRAMGIAVQRGDSQPLHRTAAGKVLVADSGWWGPGSQEILAKELMTVRATGIAYERGELQAGICGVAAAVRGPKLEPVAAISVIGPSGRFRPEAVAPHVRRIAQIASREVNAAFRMATFDSPAS